MTFAEDMAELGVSPTPPPAPPEGATLGDLVGLVIRAAASKGVVVKRPESSARSWPCGNCTRLAAMQPQRPIAQCEPIRREGRTVAFAWACSTCIDMEWSKRWRAAYAVAEQARDEATMGVLDKERERWKARGRKVY